MPGGVIWDHLHPLDQSGLGAPTGSRQTGRQRGVDSDAGSACLTLLNHRAYE